MSFEQPIFWHQGLFLQPQHLQYQSLNAQSASANAFKLASGNVWGVANMAIDEHALNSQIFQLNYLNLVFEDGTAVDMHSNALIKPRSFESNWPDKSQPLKIFVGLKNLSKQVKNTTLVPSYDAAGDMNSRYVCADAGQELLDLHQGEGTTQLKTMKHALNVFFNDEVEDAADYQLVQVAQLELAGEEVTLSASFSAPSLYVGAAKQLHDLLKSTRDELMGRSKQLENYKSTSTSRAAEFNPVAERYRSALRVLARYIPSIHHVCENPFIKPSDAYAILRGLVGELSTYSHRYSILGEPQASGAEALPAYQHRNAAQSFLAAKKIIVQLLDELTVSPELLARFEKDEQGRFTCQLSKEFFARQHSLYFVLETSTPTADFINSFNTFSKLAAENMVDIYAARALPGLETQLQTEQPSGLEQRAKVTYFTVNRDSEKWREIEQQGMAALIWDDAPEDLSVEMVVVRG